MIAFMPGNWEWIIIGIVLLLLFGNRLPKVMRSLGQGVVEFKKGVKGIEDELDEAAKTEPPAKKDRDKTAGEG